MITPQWILEVVEGYTHDPISSDMLAKLSIDPQAVLGFSLRDGVIRHGSRIWVGANPPLQQKLLQATHSSAVGGGGTRDFQSPTCV